MTFFESRKDAAAQKDPGAVSRRVLAQADLPQGEKRVVDLDGQTILLCNWEHSIFAVSATCSHAAESLACGRFSRGWIACPVHGARFDLKTGKPLNPPATRPLQTWPTRVVDGWIEIVVQAPLD